MVGQLFLRFSAIWGNKWNSQFTDAAIVPIIESEWANGLAGISTESIRRGINASRDSLEWPPSIAEFKRICLGIPDKQSVIAMVVKGGGDALSDKIVGMIGSYEVRTRPFDWVLRQAENNFNIALAEITENEIKTQFKAIPE